MIIVMVIIGILVTALIPRIAGIKKRAEDTAIRADIRTISQAVEMLYADTGSYLARGAGWKRSGAGWFNHYDGNEYGLPTINGFLHEKGYIQAEIKPRGLIMNPRGGADYMYYNCWGVDAAGTDGYTIAVGLYYATGHETPLAHYGANYTHTTCY